ncbi:hypothetical protein HU200_049930 [Digitaria exilis]|uniref:Uncharacterized protein n=1 Tax=Digitaria exilis TaxID=1010633 RepID=A0A835E9G9_9POAL|nr:hypothetical protein HU200_049930 [Digitaria exilis]
MQRVVRIALLAHIDLERRDQEDISPLVRNH